MTSIRPAQWKAWVAAVAGWTLLLQAALSSLTPPAGLVPSVVDDLAAHALCLGSGGPSDDANSPTPISDRAHQGCCILCAVPGLGGSAGPSGVRPPSFGPPIAAPLRTRHARPFVEAIERSPIRARAPPRV